MNKRLQLLMTFIIAALTTTSSLYSMEKTQETFQDCFSSLPLELRRQIVFLSLLLEVGQEYTFSKKIYIGTSLFSINFNKGGTLFAGGSVDKKGYIWDNKTNNKIGELVGHSELVNSVVFSPDGKTVLTGSKDETACLWDLQEKKLGVFKHKGKVGGVAFTADGSHIIIISVENFVISTISIGSTKTGNFSFSIDARDKYGLPVCMASSITRLNANNQEIFIAKGSSTTVLLNAKTGEKILEVELPEDRSDPHRFIKSAALSKDAKSFLLEEKEPFAYMTQQEEPFCKNIQPTEGLVGQWI